jgi:hypothetical protein
MSRRYRARTASEVACVVWTVGRLMADLRNFVDSARRLVDAVKHRLSAAFDRLTVGDVELDEATENGAVARLRTPRSAHRQDSV